MLFNVGHKEKRDTLTLKGPSTEHISSDCFRGPNEVFYSLDELGICLQGLSGKGRSGHAREAKTDAAVKCQSELFGKC